MNQIVHQENCVLSRPLGWWARSKQYLCWVSYEEAQPSGRDSNVYLNQIPCFPNMYRGGQDCWVGGRRWTLGLQIPSTAFLSRLWKLIRRGEVVRKCMQQIYTLLSLTLSNIQSNLLLYTTKTLIESYLINFYWTKGLICILTLPNLSAALKSLLPWLVKYNILLIIHFVAFTFSSLFNTLNSPVNERKWSSDIFPPHSLPHQFNPFPWSLFSTYTWSENLSP